MAVIFDPSVVVLPPVSVLLSLSGLESVVRPALVPIDALREYARSKTVPGAREPDLYPGLIGFSAGSRSQLRDLDPGTVVVDNWLFEFDLGSGVRVPGAAMDLWHLNSIGATERRLGSGALIGVIDTGVDDTHPDLKSSIAGYDAINLDGAVIAATGDSTGHGTHVCGLISGASTGVASDAKLHVVNVFPAGGRFANAKQIWKAIDNLILAKVHAINVSMGADGVNEALLPLFARAILQDIPVIAGIGNGGTRNGTDAPAHFGPIIGVGATWNNGGKELILGTTDWRIVTDYPAMARKPDICAPGAVWSCRNKGKYEFMQGTSQAAAVTSGVYAAWISSDPSLKGVKGLVSQLKKTAVPYNDVNHDRTYLGLLRH